MTKGLWMACSMMNRVSERQSISLEDGARRVSSISIHSSRILCIPIKATVGFLSLVTYRKLVRLEHRSGLLP